MQTYSRYTTDVNICKWEGKHGWPSRKVDIMATAA